MKFVFYVAEKDRNYGLAEALQQGARVHGDEVLIVPQREFAGVRGDYDGAACLGVKKAGKRLLTAHLHAGQHFLFFDKAYMGRSSHTRVAIDSWQPLAYFRRNRPEDRFKSLGLKVATLRQSAPRDLIMFAGSSQKYCNFHDLGDATAYAERVIRKIKKRSQREIIYRPKPSWAANHPEECKPIDGTRFSDPKADIRNELKSCHMLVTHGSNAAFDAILAGVPVMLTGEGICKSVAMGDKWTELEKPFFPDDDARRQFLHDAAYCQWTLDEYKNGTAWRDIRDVIAAMPKPTPEGAPVGAGSDSLEDLVEQYRQMHEMPKYFRGRDTQKHFGRIGRLILATGAKTILDYGCGKAEQYRDPISLQEAWDIAITCYDPGVPEFAQKPAGKFDGVICNDVMEHIPERHVQTILREIIGYAERFVFLAIATTLASKVMPDGRNCHLTVRPEEWWREQIAIAKAAVGSNVIVEAWIQPDPETHKPFQDDDE